MKYLLLFVLLCACFGAEAQIADKQALKQDLKQRSVAVKNTSAAIFDVKTVCPDNWTQLSVNSMHPVLDSLLTDEKKEALLQQINLRRKQLGKDTLLTADLLFILRPYLDWLQYEDPHYRIALRIPIDSRVYKTEKQILKIRRGLGFNLLQVNDSLIVNTSVNPLFQKGDLILAINGTQSAELMKFNYHDRYTTPHVLLQNYYLQHMPDHYTVQLLRNGKLMQVTTDGLNYDKTATSLAIEESMDKNIRIYESAGCGYIALPKFTRFFNPRIIKVLQSKISEFKDKGCRNIILDLRYNTGGSGFLFDKLFSLFIDRPVIPYLKSQKLKVSPQTVNDYPFLTTDMIGKLVELPEEQTIREIKLDPRLTIKDIRLYVLMSKNTASIAASFCNILQYNHAAQLVGDPLRHNALRYGETVTGGMLFASLLYEPSVSTREFDEYTKAVDGVLLPDIAIPYVARDYLTGRDAMLEKLLEIIGPNRTN